MITINNNIMQTETLIKEITQLPVTSQFHVMEQVLKSIKKEEIKRQMALASDVLYDDYVNDTELTSFTSLDFEDFYETK
ncbi:MAG: hypothetical protein LBE71_04410 [Dysgonamonadaceae bacterium]|nr:hypothetical protein [Dysgonamonadaceae bacterium]